MVARAVLWENNSPAEWPAARDGRAVQVHSRCVRERSTLHCCCTRAAHSRRTARHTALLCHLSHE